MCMVDDTSSLPAGHYNHGCRPSFCKLTLARWLSRLQGLKKIVLPGNKQTVAVLEGQKPRRLWQLDLLGVLHLVWRSSCAVDCEGESHDLHGRHDTVGGLDLIDWSIAKRAKALAC